MTQADYLRIHRLPDQIDLARRRLDQIERTPARERNARWYRSHATILRKLERLRTRAATLGLRDLAKEQA